MRHHSESLKASFPENLIVYVLKCKHDNIEEMILSVKFKRMSLQNLSPSISRLSGCSFPYSLSLFCKTSQTT